MRGHLFLHFDKGANFAYCLCKICFHFKQRMMMRLQNNVPVCLHLIELRRVSLSTRCSRFRMHGVGLEGTWMSILSCYLNSW